MTTEYKNVGSATITLENVSIHVVRNYLGVLVGILLDKAVADGVEADANMKLHFAEVTAEAANVAADEVKRVLKISIKAAGYELEGYVAVDNGVVSDLAGTPGDALDFGAGRSLGW